MRITMIKRRKRKKRLIKLVFELSRPSEILLLAGLPIIAIELLYLLRCFLPELESSPSYVMSIYPPMFEYIITSFALLIGGALFIDYIVKNNS